MKLSSKEKEALFSAPLFKWLPKEDILRWAKEEFCELVTFEKGTALMTPDSSRRSLGILLKGAARVSKRTADGHEVILNVLLPSQMTGVAALFSEGQKYVSTVTAVTDCRVLFFPEESLESMFAANTRLAVNYITFLSGRIEFLNRKIEAFTGYSAISKLAMYLYEQEQDTFMLPCSLNALSDMLNMGRASLYRAMDLLAEQGAIKREGKNIVILNRSCLMNAGKGVQE